MRENRKENIRVTYRRSLHKSYMCIQSQEEISEGYELKMLENRQIPCLLKLETTIVEGERSYLYDISGKQQVEDYLSGKRIDNEMLWRFLFSIGELCNILPDYLLRETGVCLELEYIYVDLEHGGLYFTYLPFWEKSLSESFEHYMEGILRKIDHQDQAATELGYQVYQMCLMENVSMKKILESVMGGKEPKVPEKENGEESMVGDSLKEDMEEEPPEKRKYWSQTAEEWKVFLKGSPQVCRFLNKLKEILGKERDFSEKQNRVLGKRKQKKEEKKEKEMHQRKHISKRIFQKNQEEPSMHQLEHRILIQENKKDDHCTFMQEEKESRKEPITVHPTEILAVHNQNPLGKLVYQGTKGCENFLIEKEEFLIGKNKQQVDGVIEAEGVSRLHARISQQENLFYLEDLNSTNGTWLNEIPLEYRQKKELSKNDRIRFGIEEYLFL